MSEESEEFDTYQTRNLDYQEEYYWRVRVSGDSNEWSNTRSFTTKSEPVTTPPPSSGSFVQVHNSNFVVGGICQYNTWAGANNPSGNMDFFLTNEDTQLWYKQYIHMLLNRVNSFTGVAYKNEPAIFSWQIMNEGRNRCQNPEILRDWYQEIAQYIKSIDPDHLVSTGEEGFDQISHLQTNTQPYRFVLRYLP